MSRSNINLVGNTTEGQNVGTGTCVYKGKSGGNLLQYKSLSVTGTTMTITSDDNNIYFSANTGGGGGTTYWSSGATGLSPANDENLIFVENTKLIWGDNSCVLSNLGSVVINSTGTTSVCGGANVRLCSGTEEIQINNGGYTVINTGTLYFNNTSGAFINPNTTSKCVDYSGNACYTMKLRGGGSTNTATGGDVHVCGGVNSSTGDGGTVLIEGGESTSGNDGRIRLSKLPAYTTETNIIYIDDNGNLSSGTTSGGASYWSSGATGLSPANGEDVVFLDNIGRYSWDGQTGTGYIQGLTGATYNQMYFREGSYSMRMYDCGLIRFTTPIFDIFNGGDGMQFNVGSNCVLMQPTSDVDLNIHAGNSSGVPAGDLCLEGGTGNQGTGGDVYICGGNSCCNATTGSIYLRPGYQICTGLRSNVYICDLPAKSTETSVIYIDSTGKLATGTTSGGVSYWSCDADDVYVTDGKAISTDDAYKISGTTVLCIPGNDFNDGNLAVGYNNMNQTLSGDGNIGLGYQVLYQLTTGTNNFGVGCYVLASLTTGCHNMAIGEQANRYGSCGCDNTAIGCRALWQNCGKGNIGIGRDTLLNNLTGSENIALGFCSLYTQTAGDGNIGIGRESLVVNTGNYNIGVGYWSLFKSTSGCSNVAMGITSSYCNTTGCNNVAIGNSALRNNSTGNTNVAIGNCAGYSETGSNKLHIGNHNSCSLVYGDFAAKTICNGSNSASWDTSSDCRIKECVASISGATQTLSQLNPVLFNYTTGYTTKVGFDENVRLCNYGFLAQEFETVFPNYVKCSQGAISSGSTVQDFRTINSGHLVPILVKAIQELEARVQQLESQ